MNSYSIRKASLLAFSFFALLILPLLSFSQISVTTTWEHQWTPNGGPEPAGLDTAMLPFVPERFGSVAIGDVDGDGDKDFVSGSNRGKLIYFQNTGTPTNPHWARKSGVISTLDSIHIGYNQNTNEVRPHLVDYDADGDLDLVVGSRWNYPGFHKLDDIHFFENIGSATNPIFTRDTITIFRVDGVTPFSLSAVQVGEFAAFGFGDLDNDGDLDFTAGGSDSCTYFENIGTSTSPAFKQRHDLFPVSSWSELSFLAPTPDMEDFDQDGDLDMYFMNEAGFIRYFPNNGTPTSPDFSPYISYPAHSFDTLDYGAFGSIQFEDVNGDGVKDLMATHWNPTAWFWSKGVVDGAIISLTATNVSCNGAGDAKVVADISGTDPPFSAIWSSGATFTLTSNGADSLTSLSPGTYGITVTDSSGNVTSDSVIITEPAVFSSAAVVDANVSCNGLLDGGATASGTGGTMPYTYTWNNGATSASITGVGAGTYSITLTDANGCTDSSSVTMTEPTALIVGVVLDSNDAGNGGGATSSATGGTPSYTYAWSNSATTASIVGAAAGTYTVTITDQNGCTDSASLVIVAGPAASISIDSNVSCNGLLDGGASVSVNGGTMPYTYLWSNTATIASITGVGAGTFTVTVTDNNGLTAVSSATITEPAVLTSATVVDSNISCNGFLDGGATASATGGTMPYSYNWNNSATTASITGVGAGTYSVTITDANGCTDASSVTMTEPAALVAGVVLDSNDAGNGGGATSSATGGTPSYTYAWSNSATTASIVGAAAGTYTVTITDANGCTNDNSIIILAGPQGTLAVDSNISCNGLADGGATLTVNGGTAPYSYLWSNGATNASITGVMAGTYFVTVTDNGGLTDVDSIVITQPSMLTIGIALDSNVSCNSFSNGAATAAGSGGTMPYAYSWSNSATTAALSGVAAGTYSVTITDANGCTDSSAITITQPDSIFFHLTNIFDASCNGFSDGGFSYFLTGGTPNVSSGDTTYAVLSSLGVGNALNSDTVLGIGAGPFFAIFADENGCFSDTNFLTIGQPDSLIIVATITSNVSCNGLSDGGISTAVTGGTMPYSYSWSNSDTTASISGLVAGTYSVTVTDANGCSDVTSVTITEPTLLVSALVVDSNVSCNSFTDGGATASATGGTMPYTYTWNNTATTASITGVAAGIYSVTITDANGCTDSTSIVITEPALLVAAGVVDSNISCNAASDGGATASATGGTMPYSYAWSNSATTASITGVVAGTYTATITDANGCTSFTSVTITEPAVLVATSVVDSNVSCNGFSDGGATVSGAGGTMPFTYLWNNTATTASITGVVTGTYSVTITDANGCTDSASVTITEPTTLVATSVVDSNVTCNGFLDGGASASAAGGTTAYNYAWSNSATTAAITGVGAGTYSVTITDANGCTDVSSVTITEPAILVALASIDSNVSCNSFADGGASASATGGTTAYNYVWSNAAVTASITGVVEGTYTVTITDANGCSDIDSVTITQPDSLLGTLATSDASCYAESDGNVNLTLSGGTMPYDYDWSNGTSGSSLSNVLADTYTVTVTDANGCEIQLTDIVGQPDSLNPGLISSTDNSVCFGSAPVAFNSDNDASGSLGSLNYQYEWQDSIAGGNWANAPGANGSPVYQGPSLTVTTFYRRKVNVLLCQEEMFSNVIIVEALDSISLNTVAEVNANCDNSADGEAEVSASGSLGGFSYLWDDGQATATATGLAPGVYGYTATDAFGCMKSSSATIGFDHLAPSFSFDEDTIAIASEFNTLGSQASFAGYLWSNGSSDSTTVIATEGEYTLQVTDDNGCSTIDTIYVQLTTGVRSLSHVSVKVFPNPASDALTLEFDQGTNLNWTLMSLNGVTLDSGAAATDRTTIDVQQLASGTYILMLKSGESVAHKRIVIQ